MTTLELEVAPESSCPCPVTAKNNPSEELLPSQSLFPSCWQSSWLMDAVKSSRLQGRVGQATLLAPSVSHQPFPDHSPVIWAQPSGQYSPRCRPIGHSHMCPGELTSFSTY